MYKNIGRKIKILAKIICGIGIAGSVIVGLALILAGSNELGTYLVGSLWNMSGTRMIISGILIMIFGSLLSWIGSFATYGYGELIENTALIAKRMAKANAKRKNAE